MKRKRKRQAASWSRYNQPTQHVSVRLPQAIAVKIEDEAKRRKMLRSRVIVDLLERALNEGSVFE